MRVQWPERPHWDDPEPTPMFIFGTVTTLGPDEPSKKKRKKKRPKAPLGFQPPKKHHA